ncbi:hypothetical protein EIN_523680 [Entamoeba invadens IP1]|uniref:TLDc domain-containing protein n=1 Tax=Entamoeba invadens IP1 TaxID=370355 RepID=A0A0A1UEV8_ENTIV|nr:hypothetical protein EIN_523680 [Entamoeba invadens IP1]ELP92470.1 hypothetical protein EIN_523680 [Entamoeba invadens IP1]|eukprot:XP_004259241.1 hypothetical protein EIN_523680 [Entamoeba invadens IP1]
MVTIDDITTKIKDDQPITGKILKIALQAVYRLISSENSPKFSDIATQNDETKVKLKTMTKIITTIVSQNHPPRIPSPVLTVFQDEGTTPRTTSTPRVIPEASPNLDELEKLEKKLKKMGQQEKRENLKIQSDEFVKMTQQLSPRGTIKSPRVSTSRHKSESLVSQEQLQIIGSYRETLAEWVGLKKFSVVYDSKEERQKMGESGKIMEEKTRGKENLVFLSFDEKQNVFGIFTKYGISEGKINETKSQEEIFSFLLQSNRKGFKDPIKWNTKRNVKCGICIKTNSSVLFTFGDLNGNSFAEITKTWMKESWCHNLSGAFDGMKDEDLIGENDTPFMVQRIFVLEFF